MKNKKRQKKPPAIKKNQPSKVKPTEVESWKYLSALGIILLISFIVYLPVFRNGFVWDDEVYILNNPEIASLNVSAYFSQFFLGNYHPLTVLVFALEYRMFGFNAAGYHTVNLFLHLINICLVYYAVIALCDKKEVALLVALLFGIHPIHVESVAWVSELKDLLYAMFFLSSYILYLKFVKSQHRKYYFLALLMFLLSLLSKAMAASLPVLLLLTDYYKGRKFTVKNLLSLAPFFLLALILGVVAIYAQQSVEAITATYYPFFQRFVFASYGFVMYLVKFIFPLNLSPFYPYPIIYGAPLPWYLYGFVIVVIGIIIGVIYSLKKTKNFFFGIGFFAVTIFLVLQLLPVGNAIMADRYTYIPSIGIFYLAALGLIYLWNKKLKPLVPIILLAFVIFFSVKAYNMSGVWKNGMTLWNAVIGQFQNVPFAYNNRGVIFMNDKKYDKAIDDFSKAIQLNPNFIQAYQNRGIIYMNQNKYDLALSDINKTLDNNPKDFNALNNRGTIYLNEERHEEALRDFNKVIELSPNYYQAYFNRGTVYYRVQKYEEAISDLTTAITLNPDFADTYYARGWARFNKGDKANACTDIKQAASLKYNVPSDVLQLICN
jgi:tetratricopeptide (TPR) repeat protein